jgi:hypothetical protein
MNGSDLHAELHIAAFALEELREEQEVSLVRLRAMRLRLEATLQRVRVHTVRQPRFISDVGGVLARYD